MTDVVPPVVTLHVWGLARAAVPRAFLRMGLDRRPLRRTPGLRFAKLLGVGHGRTFTLGDTDPRHWAILATWESSECAQSFEHGEVATRWNMLSAERLVVSMRPLSSRGTWAGERPFGEPETTPYGGPVAALTRARLVPRKSVAFWRAAAPVAADLDSSAGLRLALGIAELPWLLPGTFSLWESIAALSAFAYERPAHAGVICQTTEEGWYAEELFARLAVVSVEGNFRGATP